MKRVLVAGVEPVTWDRLRLYGELYGLDDLGVVLDIVVDQAVDAYFGTVEAVVMEDEE